MLQALLHAGKKSSGDADYDPKGAARKRAVSTTPSKKARRRTSGATFVSSGSEAEDSSEDEEDIEEDSDDSMASSDEEDADLAISLDSDGSESGDDEVEMAGRFALGWAAGNLRLPRQMLKACKCC